MNLTPTLSQVYSYFYTQGSSTDTLFFIGTKAMTSVNFAGFQLAYTNGSVTVQQTQTNPHTSSLNFLQSTQVPSSTTSESLAVPTDSFLLIPAALYNPMPAAGVSNTVAAGASETAAATAIQSISTKLPTIFVSPAYKAIQAASGANLAALKASAEPPSGQPNSTATADVVQSSPLNVQEAYNAQLSSNMSLLTQALQKYNELLQSRTRRTALRAGALAVLRAAPPHRPALQARCCSRAP